jgi:hypothetical protein
MVALSYPFGKAEVNQPKPRRVKPWQHYHGLAGQLRKSMYLYQEPVHVPHL